MRNAQLNSRFQDKSRLLEKKDEQRKKERQGGVKPDCLKQRLEGLFKEAPRNQKDFSDSVDNVS